MLLLGAGTGLLYLLRWFWWRVTAWCEIVAMVSSFVVSLVLLVMEKNGYQIGTAEGLLITIGFTTACWILTAYLGPQTDMEAMLNFYRKVRPFGPGWEPIRLKAGVLEEQNDPGDNIPLALLGWVSGCTMIWSALFAVGNLLYGRVDYTLGLTVVFLISGLGVLRVVQRLWR